MRLPPFHWWRTVFWLIPAISVYTGVLGFVSLTSMLVGFAAAAWRTAARAPGRG